MKKVIAIALALILVLGFAACGQTQQQPANQQPANNTEPNKSNEQPAANQPSSGASQLAGTYNIVVWTGEAAVDLTKKQIEDFNNTNEYGITFVAEVNPVSEATAADQMLVDVNAGADLYCFAQDQFARLVQGGALNQLGAQAAELVRSSNDAGVVGAATAGEELFAYPLTSDNGYFMYYDKSVIPEADVDSLEALIADCEAAGKYFAFEANTSAWYIASWFFGTGCVSEWTTETTEDGKVEFVSVNDTFDSPNGLIAVKGMKKLLDSPMHLSSSSAAEFANGAAIVVTGTWAYNDVQSILGDNMGATDLPAFEVDGNTYHLGSFNGCKLLGVKPQGDDAIKQAALHRLAQFLTDHDRQMERFNELAWGPANLEAQQSPEVQANPGLAALFAQNAYSIPQGQIHGSWWDIGKVIADDVKAAEDEAGLQQALDNYRDKVASLFTMTADEKNAWSVIGSVGGTSWDTDFPMHQVEPGVFESDPIELHAGDEFKCRQGASWDVNYGTDGLNGANFVVEADDLYVIHLDTNTPDAPLSLKAAWGAIGSIGGTNWDADFPMHMVEANVFETEAMELHAAEELKARLAGSWNENYGTNGANGDNLVVEADGTYVIRLDLNTPDAPLSLVEG
jgi:arabinogalactan oligomer/maltooligosaccharide transport system substrate-binding protein